MDFTTDEELDSYLLLILFKLKKKKLCPQKIQKILGKRFWVREIFKKQRTDFKTILYMNCKLGRGSSISSKFFE